MKARHELGRTLEVQVGEVVNVELFAFFVDRALDIELDLGDLARGDMLEASDERVQLDGQDSPDHAQTRIRRHTPMVRVAKALSTRVGRRLRCRS